MKWLKRFFLWLRRRRSATDDPPAELATWAIDETDDAEPVDAALIVLCMQCDFYLDHQRLELAECQRYGVLCSVARGAETLCGPDGDGFVRQRIVKRQGDHDTEKDHG